MFRDATCRNETRYDVTYRTVTRYDLRYRGVMNEERQDDHAGVADHSTCPENESKQDWFKPVSRLGLRMHCHLLFWLQFGTHLKSHLKSLL